jgi:hypothetical protein
MFMFGYYLLFSPLVTLLSWIPLIGGLLSWIFALAAAIIGFVIGSVNFTIIFALAWIRYRPVYGIILLTLIIILITVLVLVNNQMAAAAIAPAIDAVK